MTNASTKLDRAFDRMVFFLFVIFPGVAGIALLVACVVLTRERLQFRSVAVHTTGKVVDLTWHYADHEYGARGRRLFAPVVEFRGPRGVVR